MGLAALTVALLCALAPGRAPAAPAADVLRLRAERLADQGRCEEAIPLLERAREMEPRSAQIHSDLGQCQIRLRRYAEAAEAFETARRLDPDLPHVDLYLGIARFHQGDLEGAERALARAREAGEERAELDLYEGLLLLQRNQPRDAALYLERARRADPEAVEPMASYYAGRAWEEVRERARAEAALRRVLDRAGGTVWAQQASQALGRVAGYGTGRFWASATAGAEYDNNVVLRGDGVVLPEEIAGQTDVRAVGSAEVGYELLRSADWTFGTFATWYGTAHEDLNEFNTQFPTLSLWIDRRLQEDTTLRFQYDFGYAWVDADPFLVTHTATLSLYRDFAEAGISRVFAGYGRENYRFRLDDVADAVPGAPATDPCPPGVILCSPFGVEEGSARNRDGDGFTLGVEHVLPLFEERLVLRGGYAFEHFGARGRDYSFNAHEVEAGFLAELPVELLLDVTASYTYEPHRHPSTFPEPDDIPRALPPGTQSFQYPLSGVERRDEVTRVDVVLERPITDLLSVSARYAFIDNDSNADVFDYEREIVGLYATVYFSR